MGITSKGACLTAMCLFAASPAFAQNADAVWSVFVQENPTRCWVTAEPSGTTATRDGEDVSGAITRDSALLFISYWPEDERLAEVSYTGGYPFAVDSTVSVEVGESSYEMFTDGPMAWAGSPAADERIIADLREGTSVVVTATSTRGTVVADTFSLQGFDAAMDDAQRRCTP